MEIRLLTYSRLSIPSTTPAPGQTCIATRSSLISSPPMSIQNLRISDVADGRGTPARSGGCIEPASNLFLAFVFGEHSCSSPPAFPSTGLASKSCFNTPPRVTKSRSRIPMGPVVESPMRSSTANLYLKTHCACPYTMTAQATGYARSSVNSRAVNRSRRRHRAQNGWVRAYASCLSDQEALVLLLGSRYCETDRLKGRS